MAGEMSQETWPNGSSADLAELAARRDALRQAAGLPGADPRELLDAAFAELDAAVEMLASLGAERRLLRAVSQQAPAPLFLLGPESDPAGEQPGRRADRHFARLRDR
jgi:hypothetical protein